MNEDNPILIESGIKIQEQIQNKTHEKFQQTKKSFNSSKNEFLSTIFETKLARQRKQSNQNNQEQPILHEEKDVSAKFSISNQYSEFYDPLNDKLFHVKGRKPHYKKIRLNQTKTSNEKSSTKKKNEEKKFVQIHQPRNQDHEIEFKLYQEQLRKKSTIPGPGSYNISKPFVEPVYETIQKNENIVLVKLHNAQGTSNFKSGNEKLTAIYDKQKLQNPGPGDYATTVEDIKELKRQRNKSKLEEYAKKYESNYKFIFQVFNTQLNTHQSMPNYTVNDSSNGTEYNGRPQKMQQLYKKVKKENELKEEKSRKFLHEQAKNPSFVKDYERKRSISQFQISKTDEKMNQIFEFKTVNKEAMKQKQVQLKIYKQVSEKVQNTNSITEEINSENVSKALIKKKIQKLIENPQPKNQVNQNIYKRKQHLYHGFGYFDGTQKERLNTKYNVKLQKTNQTLKKIALPLPKTSRNFQSLEVNDSTHSKTSRYNQPIPQHRYNLNMLDLLVSKRSMKKANESFLPSSRISFINELGLEKNSYLNSTIEY